MSIVLPCDDDLCVAPELAILAALEVSLVVTAQVLNFAHTEIVAPSTGAHHPGPDTKIAAAIITQAAQMIVTITRYRLALLDPDASEFWPTRPGPLSRRPASLKHLVALPLKQRDHAHLMGSQTAGAS